MSYCKYLDSIPKERRDIHVKYHDTEYGFDVKDDNKLFERLILEINQAGLSWEIILKKQDNFRKAYSNFDIKKVSKYTKKDIDRLMVDSGIIRNRLKIEATIYNAQKIVEIQKEFGSLRDWLDKNYSKNIEDWVKLFKKTFKFTGGEIVREFLLSIGYIKGAHDKDCPIYEKIIKRGVKWQEK